jgi:hypothetical protein
MNITIIAAAIALLGGFGSGWMIHSWKADSVQLSAYKELDKKAIALAKKADDLQLDIENKQISERLKHAAYQGKLETLLDAVPDLAQCHAGAGVRDHINQALAGSAVKRPRALPKDANKAQ